MVIIILIILTVLFISITFNNVINLTIINVGGIINNNNMNRFKISSLQIIPFNFI